MLERIIVNQIEILLDNQVQGDFEKDLTARQRKYPRRAHAVSSGREKRVSALTGIFSIYAQNALFSFLTVSAFADVNSHTRKTRSR